MGDDYIKSKNTTVIVFCVVIGIIFIGAVAAVIYQNRASKPKGNVAEVSIGGNIVRQIYLADAKDEIIDLSDVDKTMVQLEVKDGSIRFLHSDCLDQICVHAGWQKNDLDIAVCMPNKVAVIITEE